MSFIQLVYTKTKKLTSTQSKHGKKFEFCGKLDCPDWILAQLYHASKLELARFESICLLVKETILADGKLDEMRLIGELDDDDQGSDNHFDIDDARCCFAALNHIMSGACLHQVPARQLNNELEQLGLPTDHCLIVSRVLGEDWSELRQHLL